ncbi:MAG TPA: glycine cleavage system protein GcvH [Acidobacteriota bacterium]|jgi:glycine cleavage system H protein|nr:glycine cleavage system protein GcvH [Acidobacteriota bacterium]MEE2648561.1 glycine cleavage system protein GcvH [Acidobacteriota bacterium]HJN47130.1 glycine cleavage system protein GcvH [Acidobacteriota bacterium]|tara:strand:+ start:2921 stop:3319 length:399 start_codon:yes stop_codon:yes gene_type:complete
MADYPEDYKYTKEHEWISVEGNEGTVGITYHAQAELGDVVYVELPAVGDHLEAGQPFGTIESVKAVSELYAPVSGEVTGVHEELLDQPELVNEDPHGAAWMVRVSMADSSETEGLLSFSDYVSFLESAEGDH